MHAVSAGQLLHQHHSLQRVSCRHLWQQHGLERLPRVRCWIYEHGQCKRMHAVRYWRLHVQQQRVPSVPARYIRQYDGSDIVLSLCNRLHERWAQRDSLHSLPAWPIHGQCNSVCILCCWHLLLACSHDRVHNLFQWDDKYRKLNHLHALCNGQLRSEYNHVSDLSERSVW